MKREARTLAAVAGEVRLLKRADGKSTLEGYAAVFWSGDPSSQYELWPGTVERIMPGAFDRAMREDDVRALFNHEPDHILGRSAAKTLRLFSDSKGLRYEIDLPDTQLGRDLGVSLERGDVTGSSFSFVVSDEDWVKEGGLRIRRIKGVNPLFDVGPVTFPAYTGTTAGVRSAADVDEARRALEAWDQAERAREAEAVQVRMRVVGLEA